MQTIWPCLWIMVVVCAAMYLELLSNTLVNVTGRLIGKVEVFRGEASHQQKWMKSLVIAIAPWNKTVRHKMILHRVLHKFSKFSAGTRPCSIINAITRWTFTMEHSLRQPNIRQLNSVLEFSIRFRNLPTFSRFLIVFRLPMHGVRLFGRKQGTNYA